MASDEGRLWIALVALACLSNPASGDFGRTAGYYGAPQESEAHTPHN